jgi:hypothetical protein
VAYRSAARQRSRNEDTIAVAMKELLLETVLRNWSLGSCNSWTTTMETGGVFYVVRPENLSGRQLGRPRRLSVESQPAKRRLGGWCEMAASLGVVQLSVDRECRCEEKSSVLHGRL